MTLFGQPSERKVVADDKTVSRGVTALKRGDQVEHASNVWKHVAFVIEIKSTMVAILYQDGTWEKAGVDVSVRVIPAP